MHDEFCERVATADDKGAECRCASRAYARNSLPDDLVPIYAVRKPRLEGTP